MKNDVLINALKMAAQKKPQSTLGIAYTCCIHVNYYTDK